MALAVLVRASGFGLRERWRRGRVEEDQRRGRQLGDVRVLLGLELSDGLHCLLVGWKAGD